MKQKIFFAALLVCLSPCGVTFAKSRNHHEWPKIIPEEKLFFLSDKAETGAQLTILDEGRKPLYFLQCYINADERKDEDFDWGGDFECRLTPLPVHDYAHKNLLTEGPQRDWETRAVFRIPEIRAPKKVESVPIQYPGRGKVRHFKLRGMEIEISVLNFTLAPNHPRQEPRISDLSFKAVVVPDTSVHSSVAEPIILSDSSYSAIRWPEITPFHKIVHFAGHQSTKLQIFGINKKPLYVLYGFSNPTWDDEVLGIQASGGDFHCFLLSTYDSAYSGPWLLCEDPYPIRDWEGRGTFQIDDLTGKCGDYPDYGRTREFRLRGMDLTLLVGHLKLVSEVTGPDSGRLKVGQMELEVTATPDSTAIGDIAAPSKYMEPVIRDPKDPSRFIRDCDNIRLRNKP